MKPIFLLLAYVTASALAEGLNHRGQGRQGQGRGGRRQQFGRSGRQEGAPASSSYGAANGPNQAPPAPGDDGSLGSYGGGSSFGGGNGFSDAAAGGLGGGLGGGAAGGDDNLAMLEKSVPGTPGSDYPIYNEVPETAFVCEGQVDGGYYADPEAQCQVFHICTADGQGGLAKYSFLCPNGTIFNQNYFICDWWFNFDCSEAENLYSRNEEIAAEREAASASSNSASSPLAGYGASAPAPAPAPPAPAPAPAAGTDYDYSDAPQSSYGAGAGGAAQAPQGQYQQAERAGKAFRGGSNGRQANRNGRRFRG